MKFCSNLPIWCVNKIPSQKKNEVSTYLRPHMPRLMNLFALLLLCCCACLWPHVRPQTLMLAWQPSIAAWMQPRLATLTTCARSCAQNMSPLVSNPRPNPACATGPNATRPCAGSSTAFLPTTHTSCSSVPARTPRVQSVGDRPLCPAARMKAWKSPAASRRWESATLTMSAGRKQ